MFEGIRARYAQHFQVQFKVGPWPTNAVVAIPYPITHQQQQVREVHIQTNGQYEDHGGCFIVRNATQAVVTAELTTQPFRPTAQLPDSIVWPAIESDYYYLQPDHYIQSELETIRTKAQRLVMPNQPIKTLHALYDHCLETLHYGQPIPGLYTTQQALTLDYVDCGGFSTYLGALCQAASIPSRIVAGFWAGYRQNGMHAWVEALLADGTWWPMDASIDWLHRKHRTRKLGGFGELGSDRIVINVGSNHELIVRGQHYSVGMFQWPMQLNLDGSISYLDSVTKLTTTRV